jgi:hypothetical protein
MQLKQCTPWQILGYWMDLVKNSPGSRAIFWASLNLDERFYYSQLKSQELALAELEKSYKEWEQRCDMR